MTIITKPLSEKKEAKPLAPVDPTAPVEDDIESQTEVDHSIIILRTRARRVSTVTTLCLLMTSLVVVGVGILAGTHLYRQYLRSQVFKGWAAVPYDVSEAMYLQSKHNNDNGVDMNEYLNKMTKELSNELNAFQNTFKEEFEIDTNNEGYEKITVPDFKDGRVGRFVHDFNNNKTGIIDIGGKRCFIMPLDRNNTLPPRSLLDLVQKMWEGYYKVDTQVIRETYRVEIPPLDTDDAQVGAYIASECEGMPIYKLEKYVTGVWKRSADLSDDGKFAEFAGKNVVEFDIMNFKDVEEYEKNL